MNIPPLTCFAALLCSFEHAWDMLSVAHTARHVIDIVRLQAIGSEEQGYVRRVSVYMDLGQEKVRSCTLRQLSEPDED